MARSVEIQAASLELAVSLALEQLGIGADDVTVDVLSGQANPQPGEDEEVLVRVTEKGARTRETRAAAPVTSQRRAAEVEAPTGDEQAAAAVLERFLVGIGVRGRVTVRRSSGEEDDGDSGPATELEITGVDPGILIGRRGETLDALEYLVKLVVSKQIGRWPRLRVDVEGYRARRAQMLRGLARRMADRVRTSRETITLEAMPPHERRIIHMALADDPQVMTQSTGEGENRKVQVKPRL